MYRFALDMDDASDLMLGYRQYVRKEGVLNEVGGPSTIVVFKLRTSL